MTKSQLGQYDLFLDENDWDIYYWATQQGSTTSMETAEGSIADAGPQDSGYNQPANPGQQKETEAWTQGAPRSGEWAQTVGTFKPAFRPVPQRWKNSEILSLLRRHVQQRKAGGTVDDVASSSQQQGKGLGRMPEVQVFNW